MPVRGPALDQQLKTPARSQISGGVLISAITNEAIDELGPAKGAAVLAIVNATDMVVAV